MVLPRHTGPVNSRPGRDISVKACAVMRDDPPQMMTATSRRGLGGPRFVVPGCDDGVMSSTASSAPRQCALISVLRCCSRSWRSWPVSATRLMGASWRSSPSWIATSCGAPRARGRWRRWWPGRWARHRETPHTIATVARRLEEFPRCAQGMREGRLSLDQVGVIAERAAEGSDEHYAELAALRNGQPAAHRGQAGTATRTRLPGPNRSPRSPRPPTTSSPAGGSNFRTWTRRSSTPHCSLIAMR